MTQPGSEPVGQLGVVIVDWRTPDLTRRAVQSLLADGVPADRIVVVDNASAEDGATSLAAERLDVRVLAAGGNLGYAGAANLGAEALDTASVLVFMNSDAAVHRPGSVQALASVVGRPGVGIAVPRLLNEDLTLQRSVVPFRTPAVAFAQATALARLLPNSAQPVWGLHWDHRQSRNIQSATGAVIAVRREAWDDLGGFAEDAHLFAEDHDLCWRARDFGWKTWFVAEAEFVHTGGASTSTAFTRPARAAAVARAESALIRRQLDRVPATATLRLLQCGHAARWLLCVALRDRPGAAEHASFVRGFSPRKRSPG